MNYIGSTNINQKKVTTLRLQEMKLANKKIVCLTAYDALIAKILDNAGVDLILVGDSLANIVQGEETTLPVTIDQMIYHTKAVVRGANRALVIADMPFMSYQVSADEAFTNAGKIMKESGCSAVKLEGSQTNVTEAIRRMAEAGIPVMGHLGLTPQSINLYGSYRARGKDPEEAAHIYRGAHALQDAGAFAIVLEKVPSELGKKITESLSIPTIGIGAGPYCDGQILVYTDMLGLTIDFQPRFVRKYADLNDTITNAIGKYAEDVRNQQFPKNEESY